MSSSEYSQFIDLLKEWKKETHRQIEILNAEDSERFLESVESCDKIIHSLEQLKAKGLNLSQEEQNDIQTMYQELMVLRKEVISYAQPLHAQLQKEVVASRKRAVIKQGYKNDDHSPPSIFFDKKS